MDYRDKRDSPSDGTLFAFVKCIVATSAILSILYGLGIPLYLAYQNMVGR